MKCFGCRKKFVKPGGLLFGPPFADQFVSVVDKLHLCKPCYRKVFKFIEALSK